jgi:hypothetical protein
MRKSGGLTALAVGAVLCCANAHGADTATVLRVVAFAHDARAVVLADANDDLHRYSERDLLPGAKWRVTTVAADRVVLTAEKRLDGHPVVLSVAVGDRIDLAALDAAYARQQEPLDLPVTSIVTPDAAASTRKPNR